MTIEDFYNARLVHAVYSESMHTTGCGEGFRWPMEWWVNKLNHDPNVRYVTCLECADFLRRSALEQIRVRGRSIPKTRGRS